MTELFSTLTVGRLLDLKGKQAEWGGGGKRREGKGVVRVSEGKERSELYGSRSRECELVGQSIQSAEQLVMGSPAQFRV